MNTNTTQGHANMNALADCTDAELLKAIKVHQDGQKSVPPNTTVWRIASLSLHVLFREMQRRYPNGAGPAPL